MIDYPFSFAEALFAAIINDNNTRFKDAKVALGHFYDVKAGKLTPYDFIFCYLDASKELAKDMLRDGEGEEDARKVMMAFHVIDALIDHGTISGAEAIKLLVGAGPWVWETHLEYLKLVDERA